MNIKYLLILVIVFIIGFIAFNAMEFSPGGSVDWILID